MQRVPFTCFDRDVSTDSVSCVIANQFLANETVITNINTIPLKTFSFVYRE